MYLRTARLDLDDYNHEADEGLHITSMAGTWMSVIYGFGGMRIKNGELHFNPYIPKEWTAYSFKIKFRNALLNIKISRKSTELTNNSKIPVEIFHNNERIILEPDANISVENLKGSLQL
jgi:maltose phosphorylase